MELGMVGLGKMGASMTHRLLRGGHSVVVYDVQASIRSELAAEGAVSADSLPMLAQTLKPPRAVWLMLPAGEITEEAVQQLRGLLSRGDVVIDGGNTFYKDDQRRAHELGEHGIDYLDQGTSGGIWGLANGYNLMIGGNQSTIERLRPIFETLAPAPDRGWGRVGGVGAGHFVKMIHNGIEYGMMQALAEGFELLNAKADLGLSLPQVAEIWQHGSVIRSWLLDLTALALEADPTLAGVKDWVADSGEGRWTLNEALELDVPIPAIAASLWTRFRSRQETSFAGKLLAALRDQFGGHGVKSAL